MSGKASLGQTDSFYKFTQKENPKFSMRPKPEMVIGGVVPSWEKSKPGPKYAYDSNINKDKRPAYSMRPKPDMVIGGSVPSWQNSIPGPKYAYDADVVKEKQPVFTMRSKIEMVIGGAVPSWQKSIPGPKYSYDADVVKEKQPVFAMQGKPTMIIGGDVPSWKASIPGPYDPCDADKPKPPKWSIGKKLPSEGDIMKRRSPGPVYSGPAIDAKKQAAVDSTKKNSFCTAFGGGAPRWEGLEYKLASTGSMRRYEAGNVKKR